MGFGKYGKGEIDILEEIREILLKGRMLDT